MTERFEKVILPWLYKWEGTSYENDPDDPGGETRYGIDKRSHPKEDIKNLTSQRAASIYWRDYWTKYHCGEYPEPFDWVYFNACANCGSARAIQLRKESGNDANRFLNAQSAFYRRLALARPVSQKYLKGWLNRVSDLRIAAGVKA
jgi:lysozyme family protein